MTIVATTASIHNERDGSDAVDTQLDDDNNC